MIAIIIYVVLWTWLLRHVYLYSTRKSRRMKRDALK